jgi:hypothetical protein
MKINKNLVIELLQNELIYERSEHKTALADLELERRIMDNMERSRTIYKNKSESMEQQLFELNADFFDLGDMLMEAIQENEKEQPEKKMVVVVTGALAFMDKQYQSRIEYLEELIFELGDEVNEANLNHKYVRELLEDTQTEWAKEGSLYKMLDGEQLNELVEHRRTISNLKDEAVMKEKVHQEAIYADKKCKYDLEQKIAALQKENTKLLKKLGDRQAIDKRIGEEK